ncbi:integrase catalytic domain-containing protein [Trichonephila clavipes]|nr:integrase catalytic domain-containing protein [Trichonephila clavipes]
MANSVWWNVFSFPPLKENSSAKGAYVPTPGRGIAPIKYRGVSLDFPALKNAIDRCAVTLRWSRTNQRKLCGQGANAELKRFYKLVINVDPELAGFLVDENINWKFLPPRAPNFDVLWETGVKSFKFHFKREAGISRFTYEEFLTIMTQIEGILNSRPLTPLSTDIDDLSVLTSAHFLIGRPITSISEPNIIRIKTNRLNIYQRLTKIVQSIWKRWRNNYLSNLQQRSKWKFEKDNVRVGDLVLIKEDNLAVNKWLMGRLIEVFPGKDNRIRVVTIQTQYGVVKRPISKICILPLRE